MSLQLKYEENFSDGIKRLIIEQCQIALKSIDRASDETGQHKAVHDARKAFKKIRACLRLVRDEIAYYRKENRWFRDQGRVISDIRDTTAHIESLDKLKQQHNSELYKNSFTKLRNRLLEHRKEVADKVFKEENQLQNIQKDLENKLQKIPGWELQIQSFDDIRPSIKRTYGRGFDGLQKSLEDGDIKNFHEWRKRVKYLRYQIDVLNRLWPKVFKTLERELHELTDLTGNLHDLHNLQEAVMKFENPFSKDEEKILFISLVDKQQKYLKKHALLKGQKIYTDSPSTFCDRLNVYWEIYQKEIENKFLPDPDYLEYS